MDLRKAEAEFQAAASTQRALAWGGRAHEAAYLDGGNVHMTEAQRQADMKTQETIRNFHSAYQQWLRHTNALSAGRE